MAAYPLPPGLKNGLAAKRLGDAFRVKRHECSELGLGRLQSVCLRNIDLGVNLLGSPVFLSSDRFLGKQTKERRAIKVFL